MDCWFSDSSQKFINIIIFFTLLLQKIIQFQNGFDIGKLNFNAMLSVPNLSSHLQNNMTSAIDYYISRAL